MRENAEAVNLEKKRLMKNGAYGSNCRVEAFEVAHLKDALMSLR
jgi:hypothetical protein